MLVAFNFSRTRMKQLMYSTTMYSGNMGDSWIVAIVQEQFGAALSPEAITDSGVSSRH